MQMPCDDHSGSAVVPVHPLLLLLLQSGLDHAHDASSSLAKHYARCHDLVDIQTALLRGSRPLFMRAAFSAVRSHRDASLPVGSHLGGATHVRPNYIM